MKMNYIKQLTGFFEMASNDHRLNATHMSLYMALFQFWNLNRFRNPISISRNELMQISKISGKATYHKVIKDLHNFNYIKYDPSYNIYRGSYVYMFNFEYASSDNEQAENRTGNDPPLVYQETGNDHEKEPYINRLNFINSINSLNLFIANQKRTCSEIEQVSSCVAKKKKKKKKVSKKKKKKEAKTRV